MTIKWYYILLFLLFSCSVKSSNNTDTLTIAKLLIQKGKFKRATKILNHFEQTHPDDLNVLWLYGQTAYWAGHMKTFHALYEKAMIKFPSNYYLKLDYALKLLELGEVEKANPLLDLYKKYDPSSSSLILAQAKISFWQGDYKKSLQLLSNELLLKEKKAEAEHLKDGLQGPAGRERLRRRRLRRARAARAGGEACSR
ncbi:MAG TPA: hypothetical protein VLB84_18720 [Bacteroidia bacterium]|nr:hypothetical protein [Bacteroidia bacterium]